MNMFLIKSHEKFLFQEPCRNVQSSGQKCKLLSFLVLVLLVTFLGFWCGSFLENVIESNASHVNQTRVINVRIRLQSIHHQFVPDVIDSSTESPTDTDISSEMLDDSWLQNDLTTQQDDALYPVTTSSLQ
jgi:hypothetical protein